MIIGTGFIALLTSDAFPQFLPPVRRGQGRTMWAWSSSSATAVARGALFTRLFQYGCSRLGLKNAGGKSDTGSTMRRPGQPPFGASGTGSSGLASLTCTHHRCRGVASVAQTRESIRAETGNRGAQSSRTVQAQRNSTFPTPEHSDRTARGPLALAVGSSGSASNRILAPRGPWLTSVMGLGVADEPAGVDGRAAFPTDP